MLTQFLARDLEEGLERNRALVAEVRAEIRVIQATIENNIEFIERHVGESLGPLWEQLTEGISQQK
jgi:hypothetical protein